MKNLLERAKPELIEALNKMKNEYPHMAERIISELETLSFFTDIRYGTVLNIELMMNNKEIMDLFD